jgi:hypothetical protein
MRGRVSHTNYTDQLASRQPQQRQRGATLPVDTSEEAEAGVRYLVGVQRHVVDGFALGHPALMCVDEGLDHEF